MSDASSGGAPAPRPLPGLETRTAWPLVSAPGFRPFDKLYFDRIVDSREEAQVEAECLLIWTMQNV